MKASRLLAPTLILCLTLPLLSGCFPLAATGMVVGALSISDRRTTGAQAEDQTIEIKAFNRLRDRYKGDGAVTPSITSFNRIALVTGYVPDQATKAEVGTLVGKIENVRLVINELIVGVPAGLTTYGKDVVLTTRVKTAMLDARDLNGNVIKVTTESNIVYLMGMVTPKEADRASQIASRVPGVSKVVRAFESITESQRESLDAASRSGGPTPEVKGTQASGAAAPAKPAPTPTVEVSPVR